MADYLQDLVQNIYTNCDMSGFDDYNRGVKSLSRNMADFNANTIKSQKARISLVEAETKSQIRLADYQEKYALKKKRRDENEIALMTKRNWLWRNAIRLIGTYFGIQTIRNIIRTGSELQLIQKSITGLTGSGQDWQFLDQQAYKFGLSLKTVATGYKNFYSSANMAGFSRDQIQGMFADMLLGARSIGASDQQIGGALLALEQMMSKGRVSMEELRRQLGNALPGAFEIGAKAMGVTTAQFNEMVKAGISAQEFVPKFIKTFKDQYEKGWIDVEQTVSVAQGRLLVAWEEFTMKFMHGEAGKALAQGINQLAEFMRSPEFYRFVDVLGKIFTLVVKIFTFVIKNMELVISYLPLIGAGIWYISRAFRILEVYGLRSLGRITKATMVLYGRWLLLFGILAVLQDLIYGLFAPEMTDSLTENILRKLGVYKNNNGKTPEQIKREKDISRAAEYMTGRQEVNTGAVVYIDDNGMARIISGDRFKNPTQPKGYLHWSALSKGEQEYFKKYYSQPFPHNLPLGSLGYAPTELNKTDTISQQFGDIKIYVVGNGDPQATAEATVDKFDAYRRYVTPLMDFGSL